MAAGQTVAVVLPGGVMPDGTKIRDAKLRGVPSAGMIMSEAELGLAAKSPGIMELPAEWQAGDLLVDHFAISDQVLEVEVTPNRPDCLSVRGLAREIAAITGKPFEEDEYCKFPWGDHAVDEDIAIEVHDPDLCPRYAGRVIRGVTIGESPLWMKALISHAGMRPISNVVDVTNYVLWALGQPLHAFDLDTIRGRRIVVRRARPGEELVTLDNELRELTDDMLVIADAERASVVAGVMGGLDSEIKRDHHRHPARGGQLLRPVDHAHGVGPGAALRGLDPLREGPRSRDDPAGPGHGLQPVRQAVRRHRLGGDHRRAHAAAPQIVLKLRPARVAHVLGTTIDRDEIGDILVSLGCEVDDDWRRFHCGGAHVPGRPRARDRPHRGGRPHPRARPGAVDAALQT